MRIGPADTVFAEVLKPMLMNRIALLALATPLALYSSCALAESPSVTPGFYLGGDFGFAFREDSALRIEGFFSGYYNFKTGHREDLHLGYRFLNGVLLELDSGYIYNSVANANGSVELRQVPVLLNLIYQLPLNGSLKPFVAFGIGGAFSQLDTSPASIDLHDVTTFAWQAETGIRYAISDHVALGLDYKCFSTGDLDFGLLGLGSMLTHSVQMSITFRF